MRGIGSRWMTLFVLFIAAAVVLVANAQTPDPNAPDVRQRDGGYTVRRGDSLSKIAKRYGTASVAELMRFGTAIHHNQNRERELKSGVRYYFAPWHKVPDENRHITEVGWTTSRARLQVTSNGYSVQVDDSMPGGGGDLDYNDAILTVVIK